MRRKLLAIVPMIGLLASCGTGGNLEAFCAEAAPAAAKASDALYAHPETNAAVGVAAVELIIVVDGACL